MKQQNHLYLFILTLLLLSLTLVLPISAQQPDTAPAGNHFARLSRSEAAKIADLDLKAVRALDYGAFTWLELDDAGLERLQASGVEYAEETDPFTLRLGEESFDPLKESPVLPAGWEATRSDGPDLHLVQLVGPARAKWLTSLEQSGLEIVQYIHPYAYVVWGKPESLNRAASGNFARWSGDFAPVYRIQPQWRNLPEEDYQVRMMLYRGADLKAILSRLEALGGKPVTSATLSTGVSAAELIEGRAATDPSFDMLRLTLPGNSFQAAARIPGVYSLKLVPTDGGLRGEMSNQVNVNNVDGANLAFTGYLTWLMKAGVDGSGVIMANVDGGIYDANPDLVNRMLPCSGVTCGGNLVDIAHGTHTAGIMAAGGASDAVDSRGFLRGLGVAPGANLVKQLYSPHYTQPNGMLLLISDSYANSAVLSGNSWGPSGSPVGYDDDTRQVDVGVRDASAATPGNQAFSYILSIMNGKGGTSSQGSPDEAKNIFTIGSTKMQYSNGSQDLNINDISWNSAHGPALDGRAIPHLVAPGCSVDSTVSATGHGMICGTSMASPHVSGAVGLFFEYYRKRFGSDPSPALVKAAFLPVAHDLAGHKDADGGTLGHPFDSKQGWGRMNLAEVVSPTQEVHYFDNPLIFDNTGEQWEQTVNVADPSKPFRAMLVWTDAPGHGLGGSTPAWNNDLDLVLESGGNSYYGNNFNPSSGWSQTGGAPDGMNNTEGVFVGPSASGSVTMRVIAANIPSDGIPGVGDANDQDFALVCYNCALTSTLTCNGAAVEFENGIPADWSVVDNAGGIVWVTTDDPACDIPNRTNGSGQAACADSDAAGSGAPPYDTELVSPPFDLSNVSAAILSAAAYYRDLGSSNDIFAVDLWNGSSWVNLLTWDDDHEPEDISLDLAAYIGQSAAQIRFRYSGNGYDWYAQVDDVALTCSEYGVDLSPDQAQSGDIGATVTYTLRITNEGNVNDSFSFNSSGDWTATHPLTTNALAPGDKTSFEVTVEIPAGANDGDFDALVITATSQLDMSGSAADTTVLTTTASISSAIAYALSVNTVGQGEVKLNPSGALSGTGSLYYMSYPNGTIVTATAQPANGWIFNHWSGNFMIGSVVMSQTNFIMDSDKAITATFTQAGGSTIYLPLVLKQ